MAARDEEWQQRVAVVHAWQRHLGMEPREDSKLTELFADGLVPMPPDMVARELLCTDQIYQKTLYGELIEDFMRAVADRLRARHPKLSWSATWTIVRFYGPIALKLLCVSSAGLVLPDRAGPPL